MKKTLFTLILTLTLSAAAAGAEPFRFTFHGMADFSGRQRGRKVDDAAPPFDFKLDDPLLVRGLVAAGADVNAVPRHWIVDESFPALGDIHEAFYSALRYAGTLAVAEEMLAAGADVKGEKGARLPPLFHARTAEIARLLLAAGRT